MGRCRQGPHVLGPAWLRQDDVRSCSAFHATCRWSSARSVNDKPRELGTSETSSKPCAMRLPHKSIASEIGKEPIIPPVCRDLVAGQSEATAARRSLSESTSIVTCRMMPRCDGDPRSGDRYRPVGVLGHGASVSGVRNMTPTFALAARLMVGPFGDSLFSAVPTCCAAAPAPTPSCWFKLRWVA